MNGQFPWRASTRQVSLRQNATVNALTVRFEPSAALVGKESGIDSTAQQDPNVNVCNEPVIDHSPEAADPAHQDQHLPRPLPGLFLPNPVTLLCRVPCGTVKCHEHTGRSCFTSW